jgi:hypothetical protein
MRRPILSSRHSLVLAGLLTAACVGGSGGSGGADGAAGSGGAGGAAGIDGAAGADGSADANAIDATPDAPPPRCMRIGDEMQVTSAAMGAEGAFSLLWDTDHYLVVYHDVQQDDVYVIRTNTMGQPSAAAVPVEATSAPSSQPHILKTSTGAIVAWNEDTAPRKVRGHRLDTTGAPTGNGADVATLDASATNTDDVGRPVLAPAPGGGTAVTWIDKLSGLRAVRVGLLDSNLAATGIQRLGSTTAETSFPWLAGDGSALAAIWSDKRTGVFNVRFATLDAQLSVSNEHELRNAVGDAQQGRVLQISAGYLAAWEDTRNGGNEIYAALTDTTGVRSTEFLVEEANSGDANWPHMAWNGTQAGIVYYQFRSGAPQIFISFVDHTGARVGGGSDLQVSATPNGKSARFPDIQWNGSEFGIAWVDARGDFKQIYFARVTCQ